MAHDGSAAKERYRDMRKHVLMILALGALVAVSVVGIATAAGGEAPVTVKVGTLELTANGGFSPKALSKTKQTPISLKAFTAICIELATLCDGAAFTSPLILGGSFNPLKTSTMSAANNGACNSVIAGIGACVPSNLRR